MKSNILKLQQRGFFEKQDLLKHCSLSNDEIWKMMENKNPHLVSIAIHLLYQRNFLQNNEYRTFLILQLYAEHHLYTRITICDVLSKGNDELASLLIPHLGMIGHNQHQIIGKTSNKKSYPIARDIIARTLCNMKLSTSVLLSLFNIKLLSLREAIDVIGYQLFYHPEIDVEPFFNKLSIILQNTNDDVLTWKCLTCLSAISLPKSIQLLYNYENSEQFQKEAKRSLNLIKERNS